MRENREKDLEKASRDSKKGKNTGEDFNDKAMKISYGDIDHRELQEEILEQKKTISFKEKLVGNLVTDVTREEFMTDASKSKGFSAGNGEEMITDDDMKDFLIIEAEDSEVDYPEFVVPQKVKAKLHSQWENAIIVKLLGRYIGFRALELRLQKMWAKKGAIQVINLGSNYYIVKLASQEDYIMAISGGPWMIYDSYLTLRGWEPNFDPSMANIDTVAAWLRIPDFPLEFYSEKILTFMGNRFGKTVKVDLNTCEKTRGGYARLCVNLDLSKPLLSGFKFDGRNYRIEYEGLHLLCRSCGRFGHLYENCIKYGEHTGNKEKELQRMPEKETIENKPGQWTVVQRACHQRRKNDKTSVSSEAGVSGSRYGVLVSSEEGKETEQREVQKRNDERVQQGPSYYNTNKKNKEGKRSEAIQDIRKKADGSYKVDQSKSFVMVGQNGEKKTAHTAHSGVIRPITNTSVSSGPSKIQSVKKGAGPSQVLDLTHENFPPLNVSSPIKSPPVAGLRMIMENDHVAIDSGPDLKAYICSESEDMVEANEGVIISDRANGSIGPSQN